ncbi:SHC-transforming protein 1 isoform X2 [Euwallacea fornicatus]|uniref:SHC-transforming protein 1 isoform X2 n=1 Tax=Euwallacea fornicatus TaxID=995702 RepID=UPI00338E3397
MLQSRECINRVCEAAGLKTANKRRKVDKKVQKAISDIPNMTYAGTNVTLKVSSVNLSLTSLENNQIIASHEMPKISFASGGDSETLDFVSYIAKDNNELRACYVLECGGGLTKDVIATIGQAFELRFQQHSKPNAFAATVSSAAAHSGGDADKDYYNDLPGKVPPDVMGPPPVPPLPAVVPPFTTLPPVTPNLIDFNCDISSVEGQHHDYVNDTVICNRETDVFDMQPFSQHSGPADSTIKTDVNNLEQLKREMWFHGSISRAEAERLMQRDGDFLVRESMTTPGQFVLTGMQDNNKKHLLLIDPEGVVRTKDRMFNSVSHLIQFHFDNALPIISAESALVLRHKVPRP